MILELLLVTQYLTTWPKTETLPRLAFSNTHSEGKGGFVPIFQMRKTEVQKRQGFVVSAPDLAEGKVKAPALPLMPVSMSLSRPLNPSSEVPRSMACLPKNIPKPWKKLLL